MRNDWMFDAVLAEVAYRTEELHKAWPTRRRTRRWRIGRRIPEVTVPQQRRPSAAESVLANAGKR